MFQILYVQYNPDFSNSGGTEKIVRKIGSSKNQFIQIKMVDQLKNTKYTCCTFLSKSVQYRNTIKWA